MSGNYFSLQNYYKLTIVGYGLIKEHLLYYQDLIIWHQGQSSFLPFGYKASSLCLERCHALPFEAHLFYSH